MMSWPYNSNLLEPSPLPTERITRLAAVIVEVSTSISSEQEYVMGDDGQSGDIRLKISDPYSIKDSHLIHTNTNYDNDVWE